MNELVIDLKTELDKIDRECIEYATDKYYNSRLKMLIGMWEKGQILGVYTGVNMPNFHELERQTGRERRDLKRWYDLYIKYPDKEDYIKIEAGPRALQWTQKALKEGKEKQTIVQLFTGDNEWYTPMEYIEMARRVMGSIDLDPASTDFAQEVVRAEKYFTEDSDGLNQDWAGNIWLNPPYENKLIMQFIDKLIGEKEVSQAIVLTNNNTDTQWFKKLFNWCDLLCFTTGRINFHKKDNTISAPTNGQTFFYMGNNYKKFAEEFNKIGLIMIKYA